MSEDIVAGLLRQQAAQETTGDRAEVEVEGEPSSVRRGVVIQVVGGGRYEVAIVDAAGGVAMTYARLRVWGDRELAVGDRVLVVFESEAAMPVLFAGGGDGAVPNHGHTSRNDGGVVGWLA